MADKDLQLREKQELQSEAEHTRPGLVFTPAVDIFESEEEITVLADMPGVASDGVTIDLHNNELKISGEVEEQGSEKERYLLREYDTEGSTAILPFPTASIRAESALLLKMVSSGWYCLKRKRQSQRELR